MKKRALVLGALICFVLLSFLSPAYAVISAVTPDEGTIGTTITITGQDFGKTRGTVFIGSKPCQVNTWTGTTIECLINIPMSQGQYDVIVNPQGKEPRVSLPDAFAIMPPELDNPSTHPQFVSPGETVTVGGAFLGSGKGLRKVEIESLDGKTRPCRLLEGAMDHITFVLPDGIPGRFHLWYTNAVGTTVQNYWGTFVTPPTPAPMPGGSYGGNESNDNAAAVSYNNKLWVFWPSKENNDYAIQYRRWDGSNWGDTHELSFTGKTETTQGQLTPIVVHNILYIFYTGTNGGLYYDTYNAGAPDQSKAWAHYRISDKGTYANMASVSGRFAAVWNFTKDVIEVYWTPNTTDILMKTYDVQTRTWSDSKVLAIRRDPTYPTIAPYLTAVFNQIDEDTGDYVTYLSWDDKYAGALTEMKDGVELRTTRLWYWQPHNTNRAPSLADLGETHLAVLYSHFDGTVSQFQKYNKITHQVEPSMNQYAESDVPFTSKQTGSWAPNGVVFSKKADDPTSPTGYRMDTSFYAFVENNPVADQANWQFVTCEYLGYWMPVDDPVPVDLGGGDNQALQDNFPYWPIIGMVDMPPFVENGHGECNDWTACGTEVDINFSQATTEGISGTYSAGGYVSTRARSKVVVDVSAGYSGGFDNSKTYTYIHTDTLEGNVGGRIFAYYLVPAFNVYTLDWYDLNGAPTGIETTSMEITGSTVRKEVFEPTAGPDMYTDPTPYLDPAVFPSHMTDNDHARLDSYHIDPTDAFHNFETIVDPDKSTSSWGTNSPGGFTWKIDETHSISNGFYANLKFGYKFKKIPIGIGVEGSVEILVNSTTQTGVEAITTLKNRGPIDNDPSRVTSFHVVGYWLKPTEKGYWVPENRKGMGDTPWFITYRVTDYWHP